MPYIANAAQLLIDFAFGALIALFLLRLFAELWRADFRNPLSQFIYRYSNPVLVPLRRALPNWRRWNLSALLVAWLLELLKLLLMFALASSLPHLGGWLLLGVAELLDFALMMYVVLIFGWALASMLSGGVGHPLLDFVAQLVEPALRPLRQRLPTLGGIDFSPAVAILILLLARILLVRPLIDTGLRMTMGV